MPGTGSVVTYIVIHRYKYNVPTIQRNLLPIIDLKGERKDRENCNISFEVLQNSVKRVLSTRHYSI